MQQPAGRAMRRDRYDHQDRQERGQGRIFRKKTCRFCSPRPPVLDYKDTELLVKFLTEKGKVIPRRITGNCSKHQRALARAVKLARHSGLIAFQIE